MPQNQNIVERVAHAIQKKIDSVLETHVISNKKEKILIPNVLPSDVIYKILPILHTFAREIREEAFAEGQADYKRFMLNVLHGIDVADVQMQNTGGGTKAIWYPKEKLPSCDCGLEETLSTLKDQEK